MKKLNVLEMESISANFNWGACLGAGSGAVILASQTGLVAAGAAAAGWGAGAVVGGAFILGCLGAG